MPVKIISSFTLLFVYLASFQVLAGNNYPSPDEVDRVTRELVQRTATKFLKEISKDLKDAPSFVQGALISFSVERKLDIRYLEIDGQNEILHDHFTAQSIDQLQNAYFNSFHRSLFVPYNMKEGMTDGLISDDLKSIVFTSGLNKVGINSDMDVTENNTVVTVEAMVDIEDDETGATIIKINETIKILVKTEVFFRPDVYNHKGSISVKDRTLTNAQVEYDRKGPFPNQSLIESTPIENNLFRFKKLLASGEYDVVLKDAFCGCSVTIMEDKLFNPKTGADHKFKDIVAKNSSVTGRLINQKYEPVKYRELKLVPSCSDADQIMYQVATTTTDEDGHYTFSDVPKGGYDIIFQDVIVSSLLSCDFDSTEFENGTTVVEMPQYYNVHVSYHYQGFGYFEILWPNIEIGSVNPSFDNVMTTRYEQNSQGNLVDLDNHHLYTPFTDIFDPGQITYGINWKGKDDVGYPNIIEQDAAQSIMRRGHKVPDEDPTHYLSFTYSKFETSDYYTGYNIEFSLELDGWDPADSGHPGEWLKMSMPISVGKCTPGMPVLVPFEFCDNSEENNQMMVALSNGFAYTRNYYSSASNDGISYLSIEFKPIKDGGAPPAPPVDPSDPDDDDTGNDDGGGQDDNAPPDW